MKFKLSITVDNTAFGEAMPAKDIEVARILRELANSLERGAPWPPLRDINGNTVGNWYYTKR